MLITKIIRCNLALLAVVGIYGLASDEPIGEMSATARGCTTTCSGSHSS
jgi:hypothetical protein